MRNNYNFIAPYYDFMSRVVFGNTIVRAQTCMLPYIQPNSNLLIVGGGSGWILEELAKRDLGVLNIIYIDSAQNMIALAKKKKCGPHVVDFICGQIEDYRPVQQFDCVFTGFLFDNFKSERIELVFNNLHQMLKKEGLWLYADFIATKTAIKIWQKILLKTILLFFKTVSKVEANELMSLNPLFKSHGYTQIFAGWHYYHFIQSLVYKKG